MTDQQGAVVTGAKVTISNSTTGYSRTMNTTGNGTFAFELVPVGVYKLEVEATGFKRFVQNNVTAQVGAPTDLPVQIEVGSLSETVEVSASANEVRINTQDATLGNNINTYQITQLPMEARNVLSLLTLQPGVTPEGYVAGARSDQSNVTLDGVDINNAQTNDLNSLVLRLNTEAIGEFRVTTLNANANQGRSSAAQVNLVTKSGTNEFHGALFEFHRNTIFTANNFFNNRAIPQVKRPALIRNTFGGAVGGPIMKNKLFFFYSYEGRRDASQASSLPRVVPLPSMGLGQLKYRDTSGNVQTLSTAQLNAAYPAVGINPAAVQALADAASKYPANDTTVGDGINTSGFRFNAPAPVKLNSHVAKIDWNATSNQTVFVRANVIHDVATLLDSQGLLLQQFPDTPPRSIWEHPWGGVVAHTWTFRSNWVNNFRYGYTRQAFSQTGDSSENAISFRFVFSPRAFARTIARTTPVHNITDDLSWVRGNHTFQFGTNLRIINNGRTSFANAFDNAITNPSFYVGGGRVVSDAMATFLASAGLPAFAGGFRANLQNAATALIGRYSQYSGVFTFGGDGSPQPSGTPSGRIFNTQEYDFYVQDAWRMRRNLTVTLGLRYGLSKPVSELLGFGVQPTISLGEIFRRRKAGAARGVPYVDPIVLEKAGGDGKGNLYDWDKNNFQPRVAVAWSPYFENRWLKAIFGEGGKSVIRGGFAMTNDYYGQALAVAFDLNNALGFTSAQTIPANTYNVTDRPAPLFTGYGQNIRSLPGIVTPSSLSFPRQQPADLRRRIESGLDSELVAPVNYQWNFTIERELPAGFVAQASYLGRLGRNLLATRDVMALNNLVDPKTGVDWYTAATQLEKIRQLGTLPSTSIPTIPYFENVFPANLAQLYNNFFGCNCVPTNFNATQAIYSIAFDFWGNDWTDLQDEIDAVTGVPFFFNPQYGALSTWGTFARSNYNGLALSLRQRYRDSLTWDLNYTFAHSLDNASGLQTSGTYGDGFVLNPIRPDDNYGSSDFDIRHLINISAVYQLPFGKNRLLGSDAGPWLNALIGGWQLAGIFRWNTGYPVGAPYDDVRWATNWNVQSNTTRTSTVKTCVTRGGTGVAPKLFGCNTNSVYQSFRNAYPGETGERNIFRLPGYSALDLGLTKNFQMPWSEKQRFQLRWEVFNVTNTQYFGPLDFSRTGFGLQLDPALNDLTPPTNWSNFTGIQGSPRVMQIGLRFEF